MNDTIKIEGITLVKTKRGVEVRIPTSFNEDSYQEWRDRNRKKIVKFKKSK